MTSDLISRQAAIAAAVKESTQEGAYGYMDTNSIIDMLNDLPTVDAVPVVRCKDCKRCEDEELGLVYCHGFVGGWVSNDFFCAHGERRTDG